MKNIVGSLEVIYKTIELLIQLSDMELTNEQKEIVEQAIENLEESRRLLFHEKNKIRGLEN
ncbi:MAG: hypothetical protein HFF36_04420 [Coprobacillus sp.]|nr:hypothetical protein [Coprobacillus sp.]MCI9093021.1 hypothetical protein [Coprobacillus sp.]